MAPAPRFRSKKPLILISLIAPAMVFALLFLMAQKPPVDLIEKSRQAMTLSRQSETDLYAPDLFKQADSCWQALLKAWKKENDRVFFRRDFSGVIRLAQSVETYSNQSIKTSVTVKQSLSTVTHGKLVTTREALNLFKSRYGDLPIPDRIRRKASSAEMLLSEASSAFQRTEHQAAFKKCAQSEKNILQAEKAAADLLRDYFARLPEWRSWAASTIAQSKRKNSTAVIVDKMAHRCRVYSGGTLKAEYAAELGPHWIGDKQRRGDGATPEGQYHITQKKGAGHSKYYKALAVNYPNETDRKEFRLSKQSGSLSSLGGLIEIHGHGGKGANWTEGCIALSNHDIDNLFNRVSVGTPVTIVGSLSEPLEHLK